MIAETSRVYSKQVGECVEVRDYAIVYENVILNDFVKIGEHSVVGRTPTPSAVVVRKFDPDKNQTNLGKNSIISANVILYGDVTIGEDSLIGDNSSIMNDVEIGNKVLISRNVTVNSSVTIGNNTRIMDNSHITGRVKIGNNVFISVGVLMANDNSFGKYGFNDDVRGAIIEDYVSIGVGSVILPNVRIGKGSIVSAGSLVKKDVPEGVIVAGSPAKVVVRVPKHMKRY